MCDRTAKTQERVASCNSIWCLATRSTDNNVTPIKIFFSLPYCTIIGSLIHAFSHLMDRVKLFSGSQNNQDTKMITLSHLMQLLVTSGIHLHFFILLYLLMQNYVTLAEDRRSQENSKSCGTKYWPLNACLDKFTLSKKYKHITLTSSLAFSFFSFQNVHFMNILFVLFFLLNVYRAFS